MYIAINVMYKICDTFLVIFQKTSYLRKRYKEAGINFGRFHSYTYDAMVAVALAFNASIEKLAQGI